MEKKAISQTHFESMWSAVKKLVATKSSITEYTITVPASNWKATGTSGTDSYYSNTVALDGVTTNTQLIYVSLASDYVGNSDAEAAYRQWTYLNTSTNSVIFYSATAPTTDFAVVTLEAK